MQRGRWLWVLQDRSGGGMALCSVGKDVPAKRTATERPKGWTTKPVRAGKEACDRRSGPSTARPRASVVVGSPFTGREAPGRVGSLKATAPAAWDWDP